MPDDAATREMLRRAALARQRFYGHLPSWTVDRERSSHAKRVDAISPSVLSGLPCPGRNQGWLKGLASQAFSLASVIASRDVSASVYADRMAACESCPYVTKARDHHWCGCCGCPKWQFGAISSALEYKNKKSAWRCARPDPAFGPVEPAESG